MDVLLNPGERLDDLHRDGLQIIQNPDFFCFGQDAVLLSWFARAGRGETVLDLCCGNGIIPLLMSAKNKSERYEGLELLQESADLARRSVSLNGLDDKIKITVGDLKEADKIYPSLFDVITVNPPYMSWNCGIVNPSGSKAVARHEIACTLEDVVSVSSHLLKFGGRFYMVHRPSRLVDIFYYMRRHKIEPKRLLHVSPKKDRAPSMVLVEGALGGKPFMKVLPNLVVYDTDNRYTKEVMDIYYG